ncbi:serine hydrolase domain-containing protein [uncultured Croceitalea sp.]|uniref:serine hydrolase domain-containing protein n=1 Tax=uncultured Croceitalea sp. TaxID=1798908 RepID=UPI0033061CE5
MLETTNHTVDSLFTYFKNIFSKSKHVKPIDELLGIERSEAILHKLVAEKKVSGIAVSIIKHGETIFQKGFGYADIENKVFVSPTRTIFRIASISKCITGLAFGKMVEEGILDFDDSFYKHVPYYPKKKYDFTLRQLASHTAGIRAYRGKEFGLNKPYDIKESLEVFQDDPLVFEPGKSYLYNSFDFVLLSLAMQEASGIPFEEYVKEKVLDPLGMKNSFPPSCHPELVKASNKRLVKGLRQAQPDTTYYTKTPIGFKKALEVNNFYKLAGGGYLSTCEDIAKLGGEILRQKLLNTETYKELLTAQLVDGNSIYYGLGFQVSEDKYGRSFMGHVGSSVGAYSNLFVYPKEELVVSILMNCTDTKVQDVLDDLISKY